MNVKFPIPTITEKFVDDVVFICGGRRPKDKERNYERIKNADYLFEGAIAELKIIEEEGLLKEERQSNIAKLFKNIYPDKQFINIASALNDPHVKRKYFSIIEKPIRKVIRKASRQIKSTKNYLGLDKAEKIIIIVNNGFYSINPEDFKRICLKSARNDTKNIDSIVTISIYVIGNGFDTMAFVDTDAIVVNPSRCSDLPERLRYEALMKYAEAMTYMMRNQIEASLSPNTASYVEDILFEKYGISIIYPAPTIPNSIYENE